MGVTKIDSVLMILGVSLAMTETEREIVTRQMIKGFNSKANEAGTIVTGGQSVMNPWPMIGGVAMSVVERSQVVFPNNAMAGDVLFLTKPLGTQVIVNAAQWCVDENPKWLKVQTECGMNEEELWETFNLASKYMCTLNLKAARIMQKFKASACTDVTGFGIKGHCENLVKCQERDVSFKINFLPILNKTNLINDKIFNFKLLEGYSAETSGGLLIVMGKDNGANFKAQMDLEGISCWEIGTVTEGERTVEIVPNVLIV